MSRGLLSRLGKDDRKPDTVASVVAHLRDLLNSRHGDAVTVPEYGLMDFSDVCHNFPEAITYLQQSIRQTIMTYEPRLKNVSVRYVPDEDPLVRRFEIVARLADDRRSIVRLKTRCGPEGRFSIH